MNNETSLWTKLRVLLYGTAAGVLAGVGLLVLFSGMMVLMHRIPRQALVPMGWIAVLAAALLAGWVSGIASGRRGLLYGLANGLVLYGILFVGHTVMYGAEMSLPAVVRLGFMLLAGMTGGILGVNRRLKY